MIHKLGRRPARHTLRTMRAAIALSRHLTALGPAPPTSTDYVSALMAACANNLGMFLNDQLGDCVCADSAHQVMLHTANAGSIVIPTDDDVLKLYEAVGGYVPGNSATDQGCDETSMCEYLMTNGLSGQKSAGSGPVDPAQLDHVRWTVQLFGACRLGIVVDSQMEQQYSAGQPWTTPASADDPDAGGHDVPVVKYDADYAYVITWGKVQPVAWSLMAQQAFLEEAHAEVWPDFVAATGSAPNGLDLQQLLSDLPVVTGEIP